MMIYIAIIVWFYLAGLLALYATSYDLNGDIPRDWRPYFCLALWPIAVSVGFIGDLYDTFVRKRRPKYFGGNRF